MFTLKWTKCSAIVGGVKPKIEMQKKSSNYSLILTVHTKWEILVKILLKLVELFKSYGLFWWAKSGRFSGF
jgi:hypothetical protein